MSCRCEKFHLVCICWTPLLFLSPTSFQLWSCFGLWTFSSISSQLWEIIAIFTKVNARKTCLKLPFRMTYLQHIYLLAFFPLSLSQNSCSRVLIRVLRIKTHIRAQYFSDISDIPVVRTNLSTCPFTVTNGTKMVSFFSHKGAAYCRLERDKNLS